ncbi:hypothetical protein BJX68DRAFT_243723 [Aspergillus pseudodeflectus]|uniref:Uncharacterized protein n=1 Tax=Aspergillus pseudodeflectus TaxID=176178 RepID=A0ABR4JXQ3_9EURO
MRLSVFLWLPLLQSVAVLGHNAHGHGHLAQRHHHYHRDVQHSTSSQPQPTSPIAVSSPLVRRAHEEDDHTSIENVKIRPAADHITFADLVNCIAAKVDQNRAIDESGV